MTGSEWDRYFKTLPIEKRVKLLDALETLANDDVFKQNFGSSFLELAYLIKSPLPAK